MIRDLLNPSSGILDLREDAKGGIQVAGLTKIKARSTDEVTFELSIFLGTAKFDCFYKFLQAGF